MPGPNIAFASFQVSADDRTYNVIRRSLEKYNIEAKSDEYSLFQVIPGSSKLIMPYLKNETERHVIF